MSSRVYSLTTEALRPKKGVEDASQSNAGAISAIEPSPCTVTSQPAYWKLSDCAVIGPSGDENSASSASVSMQSLSGVNTVGSIPVTADTARMTANDTGSSLENSVRYVAAVVLSILGPSRQSSLSRRIGVDTKFVVRIARSAPQQGRQSNTPTSKANIILHRLSISPVAMVGIHRTYTSTVQKRYTR